jgi:hypothetical protein
MINANLCRRSDFTLKILLVVFVVTIIGATIGLKFVRSENKIVCMWLVPIGCLGGIFALMMFPSITTNDLLLGKDGRKIVAWSKNTNATLLKHRRTG